MKTTHGYLARFNKILLVDKTFYHISDGHAH